jgi:hypothetical protein
MSKNNPFNIVGKTPDGQLVISGLLRFEETYGLPLEDILEYVKNNNLVPSWFHVIDEAKKQGVNIHKFLTKLESCVVVVYGRDYWSLISTHLTSRALDEKPSSVF